MSLQRLKLLPIQSSLAVVCVLCTIGAVCEQPSSTGAGSSGHQVVLLLDVNPHQRKVLGVELALAEGMIEKLREPGNSFSVITFGSNPPTSLKSGVEADEAITAIRGVSLDQTRKKYFGVYFYDALRLGLNEFGNDPRRKSILVISEGNDYFPRKTFKETLSQMQQAQIICDAAMVASHSFYGTKGIQRYGFDLRRLVNKTHGEYVEVGGSQKKVPSGVEHLSRRILTQ